MKPKDKYPKIIYLDVSVADKQGSIIVDNMLDHVALSYATDIVIIDKKGRITFKSWEDDYDFIETLDWIMKELKIKITTIHRKFNYFNL